eukprot:SAG31_NODE_431_length_15775_cov_3.350663_5_plen_130_part_00
MNNFLENLPQPTAGAVLEATLQMSLTGVDCDFHFEGYIGDASCSIGFSFSTDSIEGMIVDFAEELGSQLLESILNTFGSIKDTFTSEFKKAKKFFENTVSDGLDAVGDAAGAVVDFMSDAWKGASNFFE